jgi:hypothetical protein
VAVTGETSYNLEQQMAELGIAPSEQTIGTANQVAIQPEFWESVPNGNYYVYSLVGLPPSLYNETTNHVADAYRAQFDSDPPSYALEAYDSVWIRAATTSSTPARTRCRRMAVCRPTCGTSGPTRPSCCFSTSRLTRIGKTPP